MTDRALLQQALEYIRWQAFGECRAGDGPIPTAAQVVAALQAALAQPEPEPEPVAYMTDDGRVSTRGTVETAMPNAARVSFHIPLYTRPAVPLTRQQVKSMMDDAGYSNLQERADFINGIRHAELAHGIKPISECSDGEIYSRLSARAHKPDWSAA